MANGIKKKLDKVIVMISVFLTGVIAIVSIAGYYTYVIDKKDSKIAEYTAIIYDLNQTAAAGRAENKELKEQINLFKDRDDILKRDIELYIKIAHPKVSKLVANAIAKYAVEFGRKYHISPELVVGIIKVESNFDPMAVGPRTKSGENARGLMQVMPEWVPKLELKSKYDFHDIDTAIESGVRVFKIHLEENDNDISSGLYDYVNHDTKYVTDVYVAMGKFVTFRSTIDDGELNIESDIDRNGETLQVPVGKASKKAATPVVKTPETPEPTPEVIMQNETTIMNE